MNKKLIIYIRNLFLSFIFYAIIGWIYEEVLFLVEDHVLVNRGFMFGPWLPIYGFGGLIIYKAFHKLKEKKVYIGKINIRPIIMCLYIAISACLVELLSTYIIDMLGGNYKSLWDYSDDFLNFEGRIALFPEIKFGFLGILILYLIQPILDNLKKSKNQKRTWFIAIILFVLFIIDLICRIPFGSNYVETLSIIKITIH